MQMFDALPPRIRSLIREDPDLNEGFILVAMDDGMSEDEIIEQTKKGTGWWMK